MIFADKRKTMSFSTFDWNNHYLSNIEENNDLLESTFAKSSPSAEPHVFRFPSVSQNGEDPIEKRFTFASSRISDVIGTKVEEAYFSTDVISRASCNFMEGCNSRDVTIPEQQDIDQILAPLSKVKCTNQTKSVRRDVVNKTIFRIIRRFFLKLLEKAVPDFKKQKKSNLINMLTSFADFLFPTTKNSQKIAEVMSALMFRRELLHSKVETASNSDLKVFMDIQSKYTHKLLLPVTQNPYFESLFSHFIENGIEFFAQDENVVSNPKAYKEELSKISHMISAESTASTQN